MSISIQQYSRVRYGGYMRARQGDTCVACALCVLASDVTVHMRRSKSMITQCNDDDLVLMLSFLPQPIANNTVL